MRALEKRDYSTVTLVSEEREMNNAFGWEDFQLNRKMGPKRRGSSSSSASSLKLSTRKSRRLSDSSTTSSNAVNTTTEREDEEAKEGEGQELEKQGEVKTVAAEGKSSKERPRGGALPPSKHASKHVLQLLDNLIDSEVQRSQHSAETLHLTLTSSSSSSSSQLKNWLGKLRIKLLRQVSENSLTLFQDEDHDVNALQEKVHSAEREIRELMASTKENALLKLKASAKSPILPSLPKQEVDTAEIEAKAESICTKFHEISRKVSDLLQTSEDRVQGFENSLQAAQLTLQTLGAVPQRAEASSSAVQTLQNHLNSAF
eukprot:scaffold7068_cov179-Ochromonas_danica.AAC.13